MQSKHNNILLTFLAACLMAAGSVYATDMSSTNYSVKWDVTDGGGGNSSSANYIVEASSGQPTAIGVSSSANYSVTAGFESIPDSDADKILDAMDNCTLVPNADQRDTNGDGFGNICDADLNGDLQTNLTDFSLFKSVFTTADPDADFNGDGSVDLTDFSLFKVMFQSPPGPSGLNP